MKIALRITGVIVFTVGVAMLLAFLFASAPVWALFASIALMIIGTIMVWPESTIFFAIEALAGIFSGIIVGTYHE